MNVSEALQTCKFCRALKPDPVNKNTLLTILDDARHAPFGANTQPWDIYVAGVDLLKEIHQAYLEKVKDHVPQGHAYQRAYVRNGSRHREYDEAFQGIKSGFLP